MDERMKNALDKAKNDRERAINELEAIRTQSLKTSMNCQNIESLSTQQNSELRRL